MKLPPKRRKGFNYNREHQFGISRLAVLSSIISSSLMADKLRRQLMQQPIQRFKRGGYPSMNVSVGFAIGYPDSNYDELRGAELIAHETENELIVTTKIMQFNTPDSNGDIYLPHSIKINTDKKDG